MNWLLGKLKKSHVQYALFATFGYVLLRLLCHLQIVLAGYFDGGAVSYDTFYHYAFANELHRKGTLLFFQNPFGTLDSSPHLFNLFASVLEILRPLYVHNFFGFDVGLGAIGVFVSVIYLVQAIPPLPTIGYIGLLFGGGLNAYVVFLIKKYEIAAQSTMFWGLNFLTNQLATPEIIYHALFFWGVWAVFNRRNVQLLSCALILSLLHPFTSVTFGVVLVAWCVHEVLQRKGRFLFFQVSAAGISIVLPLVLFNKVLPSISKDARFFLDVYHGETFILAHTPYILALIIPIILTVMTLFMVPKKILPIFRRQDFFVFFSVSIFCIVASSAILPINVPQPAHWSRVYPYVFIFGLFAIVLQYVAKKQYRILLVITMILVLLGIYDNIYVLQQYSSYLLENHTTPTIHTYDQESIISILSKQPPSTVLYLRACKNRKEIGSFEYAIMSKTLQSAEFGHRYFSPFLENWKYIVFPCNFDQKMPTELVSHFKYIILDVSLRQDTIISNSSVLYQGKDLQLLKTHWPTKSH